RAAKGGATAPRAKQKGDRGGDAPAKAPAKRAAKKTAPARAWVEPRGDVCPTSHPVKGKLSSKIFHVPGGLSYARTKPDRCYADERAAAAGGLRPAKRWAAARLRGRWPTPRRAGPGWRRGRPRSASGPWPGPS